MFDCKEGDLCTLLNVYNRWKDAHYSPGWCKEHFIQAKTMESARVCLVLCTSFDTHFVLINKPNSFSKCETSSTR